MRSRHIGVRCVRLLRRSGKEFHWPNLDEDISLKNLLLGKAGTEPVALGWTHSVRIVSRSYVPSLPQLTVRVHARLL